MAHRWCSLVRRDPPSRAAGSSEPYRRQPPHARRSWPAIAGCRSHSSATPTGSATACGNALGAS
eukprot:1951430-Prymnesium_polylepis.1